MQPHYQKLKHYICDQIDRGVWAVGHRVDSENELAARFGVSRMTANRALRELTSEGVLTRVHGVGTFVAEHVPQAPLFEIRAIADEVRGRGHHYTADLVTLQSESASPDVALALGLPRDAEVFHSVVVHRENNLPIQLEKRWVNPALVPEYLAQDFSATTPSEYLVEEAPLTEAEHIIEAILPDATTTTLLELAQAEPCILLRRRTWSGEAVASAAHLIHPNSRYHLGSRFKPDRPPVLAR